VLFELLDIDKILGFCISYKINSFLSSF